MQHRLADKQRTLPSSFIWSVMRRTVLGDGKATHIFNILDPGTCFTVSHGLRKRLCSMKERSSKATQLEVVYHWTGEENVEKIIETWAIGWLGPVTADLQMDVLGRINETEKGWKTTKDSWFQMTRPLYSGLVTSQKIRDLSDLNADDPSIPIRVHLRGEQPETARLHQRGRHSGTFNWTGWCSWAIVGRGPHHL